MGLNPGSYVLEYMCKIEFKIDCEFYGQGKCHEESCTLLTSNLMICVKFPIRTGSAWILQSESRCMPNPYMVILILCYVYFPVDSNQYHQILQSSNVSIEMDLLQVGSEPVGMRCPYCTEDVMTRATYRNTTLTHIIAALLTIFFW